MASASTTTGSAEQRQLRHRHDSGGQRLEVAASGAAIARGDGQAAYLADHGAGLVEADGREADAAVAIDLGQRPAGGKHDDRPDVRVAPEADQRLGDAARHLLHEQPVDDKLGPGRADRGPDPIGRGAQFHDVTDAEQHPAHVALVRDLRPRAP